MFWGVNNEMTNKMTNHIDLYKEYKEEQGAGEFMEEKNFTWTKWKNSSFYI